MSTKQLTLEQIEKRLAEIQEERDELNAIDFEALLRKAVIEGDDGDAVEDRQEKTERRLKRLRIEAEALEEHIPAARLASVQPRIDAISKQERQAEDDARKAADKAIKAMETLRGAMEAYKAANSIVYHDIRRQKAEVMKEISQKLPISQGLHHPALLSGLGSTYGEINEWMYAAGTLHAMERHIGSIDTDLSKAA